MKISKAFLRDQCKEVEENNNMGKTRDVCNKIKDKKGTFHAKIGTIKEQKRYEPNRSRRHYEDMVRTHRRTVQKRSS